VFARLLKQTIYMALIENKITVSGDAIGKLLKFLNEHINNFFKQPKWLLMIMFIVICGAVAYFMYTSRSEKESI
jgi:flagellar biosynthesis/type III secretory pathway M-ring protein FliF/YscJ